MASESLLALEKIKREKQIGIIAKGNQHIFSNGILQNAYFIFECFEKLGLKCQFLGIENSTFGYRDLPIKKISTNALEFDPSEYHTVIAVTSGLLEEEYEMFKKHNVFVITFTCGNQMEYNIEEFVRGDISAGSTTYMGKNTFSDEIWIIPSMKYSTDYISIIRAKPVYIVPHLWSPTFLIDETIRRKKKEADLMFDFIKHNGNSLDILILESNIHFTKSSWLPIVSCESLNKDSPTLIDTVYVFNFPENKSAYKMVDDLEIGKKLRRFKRLSMPEIMLHFNEKNTFPIIISHQSHVSLNYLFYEALYYGWPLVHNSPDLEGCGYYYPENDIVACAAAITFAFKHHNKNIKVYTEKAREYLKRVDPCSEQVSKTMDGMIDEVISKSALKSNI